MNTTSHTAERAAIEARLGTRLAAGLTARAELAPHDVTERLRFAREKALARAREVRLAAPGGVSVVGMSARGGAVLGGFVPMWQRLASVLPLLLLVCGLVAIDRFAIREQVLAAAEIDAQLLSDDLPPAAYTDPGFAEFLRSGPSP